MSYETVIGLEIHVKLNSATKLYCGCANSQEFDDITPNTHVCPVCTGQPGALPVVQEEALGKAVQLGLALWCHVEEYSFFDRKSYFYPDLPMGYQITQYTKPTCINGVVTYRNQEFSGSSQVRIRDAHIENDTGKTTQEWDKIILDYNRAGTPLVEVVTEPDFRSDDDVVAFLKDLQRTIKYQGIGDADMEKGQMRCDVNVSIRPVWSTEFGTRVELKNMNSFSAIKRAIQHEVERQIQVVESGGQVEQETRGWDDTKSISYVMRSKADALDYRYFPEPDLPPLHLTKNWIEARRAELQELPAEKIKRYREEYDFNKEYINVLIGDQEMNMWFEQFVKEWCEPWVVARRFAGPLAKYLNQHLVGISNLGCSRDEMWAFFVALASGELPEMHAKQAFDYLISKGGSIKDIIMALGLTGMSDEEMQQLVERVCAENPQAVADLHAWKMQSMWFLIGQMVKSSGGKADPKKLKEIVEKHLALAS